MHLRCPACGSENEADASFCTHCGVFLNGPIPVEHTVGTLYPERRGQNAKKLIAASVAVLVLISGAMLFVTYSGDADFDIEDNGNEVKVTNTSSGSMHGYRWIILDEMNYMNNLIISEGDEVVIPLTGEGSFQPGIYRIMLVAYNIMGVEKTEVKRHVINGERVQETEWKYNNKDYTLSYSMTASSMLPYLEGGKKGDIERWPGNAVNEELVRRYTDVTSVTALENLAKGLREKLDADNIIKETDRINFIMAFVQYTIGYMEDQSTKGSPEFWRYPAETLFAKVGDCEDVAMLTMTLIREVFKLYSMDVDVALVLYWGVKGVVDGHAIAAVALDKMTFLLSGSKATKGGSIYCEDDGKTYYVCETTSREWEIGRLGLKYQNLKPDHLITI